MAVILIACSEDDQATKPFVVTPDPNKPNHPPSLFSVSVFNIGTDYVEIKWDNVTDPDGDTVYLQVFLRDLPVSSVLSRKTEFTINNLKPLQTYEGYVQATDNKSESLKVSFSFKTKSKITVFSRLYPNLAAGEDMLVTQDGEIVSAMGLNKYDSLGNFIFYQHIDPPSYGPNYTDLIQSDDGGFLFCNRFNFQKFDKDGNHLWTSEGFDGETVYNSLAELPDGGYLAVGNNVTLGAIIQKFDSQGKKVWLKDFGGLEFMLNCTSIVKTPDGSYVAVGSADELQAHLSISKIDSEGNILWVKSYANGNYIWDAEVVQSSDGSLIIGASTIRTDNANVAWILNLSDSGDVIWEKSFSQGYGTQIWSIIELRNSDIVFVGLNEEYYNSRALLLKLSHTGDLLLSKEYFPDNEMDYSWMFNAVRETKDGGLIIMGGKGCVWDSCEERGSWLLKTDNEGNF
jgi:WD40 repeat protein